MILTILDHTLGVMTRRALTDYTFSDGTKIPAGSTLSVSATHAHLNPETYEDPMKFDGFRFIKMKERNEAEGLTDRKFDVVTTSLQSLTFGHGRHVCPGRFLAAAEIKMMLAYIITTYDLKLASDIRPPDLFLFHLCIPNLTAEILFRKRRGWDVSRNKHFFAYISVDGHTSYPFSTFVKSGLCEFKWLRIW